VTTASKLLISVAASTAALLAGWANPAQAAQTECATPQAAQYDIALPGHPFGAALSADGSALFATVVADNPAAQNGIAVMRCQAQRYALSHVSPLEPQPVALALSRDGALLLAADDAFVAFLDVRALIDGRRALLGAITDAPGDPEDNDAGSVHVAVSHDGGFAFVADEQNDTITVIDLERARATGFTRSAIVGQIPVGNAPIALVFSPDGKVLYSTAEIALRKDNFAPACRRESGPPDAAPSVPPGVIYAIDVAKAVRDPAHAVVAHIPGACSPVRMAIAPNGKTLYVTNRNSNSVTSYSAERLQAGRTDALLATVPVGPGPVAVAVTSDGRYVLAGNTDRFGPSGGANGSLSVIDARTMHVVGTIPTGAFPREFSSGFGSTLFLSNYRSNTITVFDTTRLSELIQAPKA
jgi:6-phosphogluconolactonase (cycloisomerase 2 family)